MTMQTQLPHSESFLRGLRDGRLLAEDCPGRSESDLRTEVALQLHLLAEAGVILQAPNEYVRGWFAGYQTNRRRKTCSSLEGRRERMYLVHSQYSPLGKRARQELK
jgi:hypothetical protein